MCKFGLKSALLGLSLLASITTPALASSMPKADASQSSISLGTAPSLALGIAMTPQFNIGVAAGIPVLYDDLGFLRYDLRTTYLLLEKEGLYIRAIGGIFGDVNLRQEVERELSPIGIEAGIGVAYHFSEQFIGRVNIVAGIAFPRSTGFGLFAPSGGIELAYRPNPSFEAIVGFNGYSDLLSLRYLF